MSKKFDRLARKVHREYHNNPLHGEAAKRLEHLKGREMAEAYIGRATAGKVYREQLAKKHGCHKCGAHHTGITERIHQCHDCGTICTR